MVLRNIDPGLFQLVNLLIDIFKRLVVGSPEIFSTGNIGNFSECSFIHVNRNTLILYPIRCFHRVWRKTVGTDANGLYPYPKRFGNLCGCKRRDRAHVV